MMGTLVRIGRPILIFCSGFAMSNFRQSDSQIIFSDERVPARWPAFRIASATAAYEHDDDAAPRARAVAIDRGLSSGKSRAISRWETTAWTTAESAKPRISGHRISHPMANAMLSARRIDSVIGRSRAR